MNIDFSHLISLIKKLGLSFLIFSITRFLYFLFNLSFFNDGFPIDVFFYGLRFDLVAISYLFAPFILLSILPFAIRTNTYYQKVTKGFFHLANGIGILFNLIDLAYFQFTLKRTTADFFRMISTGDDFMTLLPKYVGDYWHLLLILIALIILTEFLYRKSKITPTETIKSTKNFSFQVLFFLLVSGFTALGFRGGVQLKPIDIINAANHASPKNVPLVLNTPFCIIKTILNEPIPLTEFYSEEEATKIYSPLLKIEGEGEFKGRNVVLVILESFAKEHVGFFNKGKGYTPFLDSLAKESYSFTNAYSNGSRSIEALPAILAGIPPLMTTPYVISNYSSNKIDALPGILNSKGYTTSFYHGGSNGTMGFNGFSMIAGVSNYYGMDEYPSPDKDYDGNWGIYDEPYLQYFSSELNKKKEPFFSTIFTLSSHHPYAIPKKHKNKFDKGTLDAHETIGYTDYALREFFNTSKKSKWFDNTIFVFTADHSSISASAEYSTLIGRYAIPMFIYDPSGSLKGENNNYFQHSDITPTLLSLLGIDAQIVSFGLNYEVEKRYIVGLSGSTYYYLSNDHLLMFDGEQSIALYNYQKDKLLKNNLINIEEHQGIQQNLEQKLKATIQQHNNRLINNELSISNLK